MRNSAFHAIENFIEYFLAGQNGRDGHMSAGQCFGKKNHVWFDIPVLDRQEAASTADAGLNFIGDKQCSVPPAKIGSAFEIIIGRHIYALALNRLDNKGGRRPRVKRSFESNQIVKGDANAAKLMSRSLLNIAKRSLLRLMLSCVGLASKHAAG
jgi:hypothetical protein